METLLDRTDYESEEWFTLDDIVLINSADNAENTVVENSHKAEENVILGSSESDTLYCISVDSPDKQFLITESGIPTHNTDEGKEEDALKGEASMIIGSIARLGRAAGVHLVLATQRPDASLIPGETKANLGARVCCGTVDSTASSMILGSGEGTRISPSPKGRIYVKIFSKGDHAQGFFVPNAHAWLDDYFDKNGLNPDGTKKVKGPSRMQKLAELEELEASGDLDAKEGNRNHEIIAAMRAAEARGEEYVPEDSEAEEIYHNLLKENEGTLSEASTDADDNADIDSILDIVADENDNDNAPAKPADDRPELGGAKKSKTYRHEDDWDPFMDTIQELNEGNS